MRKKKSSAMVLVHIYVAMSFLGILLWIPFDWPVYFTGGSSVVMAFLYGVGATKQWGVICALVWMLTFAAALIVAYAIAWKKQKYIPFLAVAAVDLLASVFSIAYKVSIDNQYGFAELIAGTILRLAFYVLLIHFVHKEKK